MCNSNSKRLIVVFFFLSLFFVRTSYATFDAHDTKSAAVMIGGIGVISAIIASAAAFFHHNDASANKGNETNKNDETNKGNENNKSSDAGSTENTGRLEDSGVFFDDAGTRNLELVNRSTGPITINSVALVGDVDGVSVGTIGEDCKSMLPESTCKVPLTATSDAYGSGGQAIVTYNDGKTLTANVTVADTTLMLYEGTVPQNSDIFVVTNRGGHVTRTFAYTNTGKFSWQTPEISWQSPFDNPNGEVVTISNNTCSGAAIIPGGSCTFDLTVKYDNPGDWGILQATGANIKTYLQNFLAANGLSVAINEDTEANHLGYRALKITNAITDPKVGRNMWISDINVGGNLLVGLSGAQPVVKYCAKDDDPTDSESCIYKTDCDIAPGSNPSISLASGKSCLIWFKAREKNRDETIIDLQSIPSAVGKITVTIAGKKEKADKTTSPTKYDWVSFEDYERESTLTASYDKSLYVGGDFSTAGGVANTNTKYIAKWDGSAWSALTTSTGLAGTVYALTSMRGDLYVGGNFPGAGSSTVNYIAKWDGSAWSGLFPSGGSDAGLDGIVYALTNLNDTLYVGGKFGTAKGGITLNNVAKWDSINLSWQALNDATQTIVGTNKDVYALTSDGSDVYFGGFFTQVKGAVIRFISKWDSLLSKWSTCPPGTSGFVYALTNMNGNIYVGGEFESVGNTTVNNIAKWDGSTWSPLGFGTSANGGVYALTTLDNDLYVGGRFDAAGSITANNIAKWNSVQNWSTLVSDNDNGIPGVNGRVRAIAGLNDEIYLGGEFSSAGGVPANYIATWDRSAQVWLPLDVGITQGHVVNALAIASSLTIVGYAKQ